MILLVLLTLLVLIEGGQLACQLLTLRQRERHAGAPKNLHGPVR